ncbi:unnamed protein product [Nesidiocoris tenuis]|uniref:DNA excision repair protein ERCC-1 n=1 Tax=Nesidiocoris tenuis TaxID=355587 RepID=A0A6H5G573_9HEMI|nr:unnamed protein product [Nesidiocoris tenuis]
MMTSSGITHVLQEHSHPLGALTFSGSTCVLREYQISYSESDVVLGGYSHPPIARPPVALTSSGSSHVFLECCHPLGAFTSSSPGVLLSTHILREYSRPLGAGYEHGFVTEFMDEMEVDQGTSKSGESSGTKLAIPRTASGEPEKKVLVTGAGGGNTLLVNPKQRGNALLKYLTGVIWEYDDSILPDYVMGRTTAALFLSLAYHNLKQDYINQRIKQLGKLYDLRVLLVQVDMPDPHHNLKHLTRICLLTDMTLMLAWSPEEAAKILQVYKQFEHKPPDMIMEKRESDMRIKLMSALTSIRSINKTDAATLLNNYGSLENIMNTTAHSLALCPGLGQQKANRLYNALHTPFLKADKKPKPGITKYFS